MDLRFKEIRREICYVVDVVVIALEHHTNYINNILVMFGHETTYFACGKN